MAVAASLIKPVKRWVTSAEGEKRVSMPMMIIEYGKLAFERRPLVAGEHVRSLTAGTCSIDHLLHHREQLLTRKRLR